MKNRAQLKLWQDWLDTALDGETPESPGIYQFAYVGYDECSVQLLSADDFDSAGEILLKRAEDEDFYYDHVAQLFGMSPHPDTDSLLEDADFEPEDADELSFEEFIENILPILQERGGDFFAGMLGSWEDSDVEGGQMVVELLDAEQVVVVDAGTSDESPQEQSAATVAGLKDGTLTARAIHAFGLFTIFIAPTKTPLSELLVSDDVWPVAVVMLQRAHSARHSSAFRGSEEWSKLFAAVETELAADPEVTTLSEDGKAMLLASVAGQRINKNTFADLIDALYDEEDDAVLDAYGKHGDALAALFGEDAHLFLKGVDEHAPVALHNRFPLTLLT